jgi:hypothetical protein
MILQLVIRLGKNSQNEDLLLVNFQKDHCFSSAGNEKEKDVAQEKDEKVSNAIIP